MTETAIGAEQTEEYDAHETAKPLEPTFTVQGGDPIGPSVVQCWVDLARARARGILNGLHVAFEPDERTLEYTPTTDDMLQADRLLRKATAAETVIWAMQSYQRGDIEVAEERASYSDAGQTTVEELAERKVMITCSTRLSNAISTALDVAEDLARLHLHPEQEVKVREAMAMMREAQLIVDPRKGNERS